MCDYEMMMDDEAAWSAYFQSVFSGNYYNSSLQMLPHVDSPFDQSTPSPQGIQNVDQLQNHPYQFVCLCAGCQSIGHRAQPLQLPRYNYPAHQPNHLSEFQMPQYNLSHLNASPQTLHAAIIGLHGVDNHPTPPSSATDSATHRPQRQVQNDRQQVKTVTSVGEEDSSVVSYDGKSFVEVNEEEEAATTASEPASLESDGQSMDESESG